MAESREDIEVTLIGAISPKKYVDSLSQLILNNDDFWTQHNEEQTLPKGIKKLKHLLQKNPNITVNELAEMAKDLNRETPFQNLETCLVPLYSLVMTVNDAFAQNNPGLIKKTFTELEKTQYFIEKWRPVWHQVLAANQSKNPERMAFAYRELGFTYKDFDPIRYARNAIACFTKVIQINAKPDISSIALSRRGQLYLQQGQFKQGLQDLEQACKTTPNNPWALFEYGEALVSLEEYEKAIPPLQSASRLKPDVQKIQSLLQAAYTGGKTPENIFESLQSYIKSGRSIKEVDEYARTRSWLPLWLEAARLGSVQLVEFLGPQTNTSQQDKEGNTALHYAAEAGHVDLISPLSRYVSDFFGSIIMP